MMSPSPSFDWNPLAMSLVGLALEEILEPAGIGQLSDVIIQLFKALSDGEESDLDQVKQELSQININLDHMQKTLMEVKFDVDLTFPNGWKSDIESQFTTMNNIVKNAAVNDTVTTTDIDTLKTDIKDNTFKCANGIYNAMTNADGQTVGNVLQDAWNILIKSDMDALDAYAMIKNFSANWFVLCQKAAKLLQFAGTSPTDQNYLDLADEVSGWAQPWNDFLETGASPVMNAYFSTWARVMVLNGQDQGQYALGGTWTWRTNENQPSYILAQNPDEGISYRVVGVKQQPDGTNSDARFVISRIKANRQMINPNYSWPIYSINSESGNFFTNTRQNTRIGEYYVWMVRSLNADFLNPPGTYWFIRLGQDGFVNFFDSNNLVVCVSGHPDDLYNGGYTLSPGNLHQDPQPQDPKDRPEFQTILSPA